MKLAGNRDLYKYLLSLATALRNRGAENLAQAVVGASRHFAGMSTEFLGESRIALREIAKANDGILDRAETAELMDVSKQIDYALKHRKP